jgi:protein involved in polysaccharide export with SLBB domain
MNILGILRPCNPPILQSKLHSCVINAAGYQVRVWLLLCLLSMGFTTHAQEPTLLATESMLISMGDTIAVTVYNEADLTVKVQVDNTGKVNFPLIGAIQVLGLSPKQLASKLEERYLDGFLVEPLVTVTIEKYRPFYIHGEVKSPGVYEFTQDLSVSQAIAIAGGLSERASSSNWFVARGSEKEPIKANALTRVLPGDIITIKASFF